MPAPTQRRSPLRCSLGTDPRESTLPTQRSRELGGGVEFSIEERRELGDLGDVVCSQEVWEDAGGGLGVSESIVGVDQRNAVALRDIDETVRLLPIGIEPTGQAQRAQAWSEFEPCLAAGRSSDEARVETGVVSGEHRAVESPVEFAQRFGDAWGAAQHRASDAVDVCGPDTLQRPAQLDEGGPLVDDGAVWLDDDGTDLENPVAAL